jgi:hypothetical protein
MFQLFTSHHQAKELKDFYKRVLHMKWLSLYGIPYGFTLFVWLNMYIKSKVIDKIKVTLE